MISTVIVIASILMLSGVIFVYDAREICRKDWDLVKRNSVVRKLKLIGCLLFVINGTIIMLFI